MNKIHNKIQQLTKEEWYEIYLAHATKERKDIVPFPNEKIQVITNSNHGLTTAKGAIDVFENLVANIDGLLENSEMTKVLDYGCGWGRITRLLPYYFSDANIHGVDVDKGLITSARKLLPSLNFQPIVSMQRLPYQDNEFDLIFANSVFSHLSEKSAEFTLAELARITKKDGIVVISVLEQTEMDKYYSNEKQRAWIEGILGDYEHAIQKLEEYGFIWGDTKRWDNYGIAIVRNEWVNNLFNSNSLKLTSSTRTKSKGSQNYKIGVKS